MERRTKAEWERILEAWELSQNSQAEFCALQGVNLHSFRNQIARRRASACRKKSMHDFVEVTLPGKESSRAIELMIGRDVRCAIDQNTDPRALAILLRGIEICGQT